MFRLRITRAARLAMPPSEQEAVIDELGRLAETEAPNAGEYAIFDVHDHGLKAVVNFHDRTLWILTPEEYRQAGLPQPPAGSG
jgi:hypothetical protein